jgi:ribonuclease R
MVCANNFIALFLKDNNVDAIYRHHPPVRSEGYDALLREIKHVGIDHDTAKHSDLFGLNEYLRDHQSYQWISQWVVRAMSQARYEKGQTDHWVLSLEAYAHFTSPIRRYPDLMVHRAVIAFLSGDQNTPLATVPIEVAARRCSRLERRSDAVVYDAIDWYQCQWAHVRVGQLFQGNMVTMLGFGVFVRLIESGVEVMLYAGHLEGMGYSYDTLNARWTHPRLLPLVVGQEVRVMISAVSFPMRRRDATWVDPPSDVL